jgi:hypothetical protein
MGILAVQGWRENKFAGKVMRGRVFSYTVIERGPNDVGKSKIEIADIALNACLMQPSFEQVYPKMRPTQGQERHDYEKHPWGRHLEASLNQLCPQEKEDGPKSFHAQSVLPSEPGVAAISAVIF